MLSHSLAHGPLPAARHAARAWVGVGWCHKVTARRVAKSWHCKWHLSKLQLGKSRSIDSAGRGVTTQQAVRHAEVTQQARMWWVSKSQSTSSARHEVIKSQGWLSKFKAAKSSSRYQFERNAAVPKRQHHKADLEWPLWCASKGSQASSQQGDCIFKVTLAVVTN